MNSKNNLVWCVQYGSAYNYFIQSELFLTEEEAKKFYDRQSDCPYREMYQTRDIWRFREKHSTKRV